MDRSRRLLSRLYATRTGQVATTLITVLAITICFVPGFDALNYYSALAVAVVGGLLGGLVGAAASRQAVVARGASAASAFGASALAAAPLVVVPIVVLLFNALRVKNCDVPEGLAFFAIGPGLSILFASQIGAACGLLVRRTWLALLLVGGVWLAWIFRDVWRFYSEPVIYAYNAYVGFFSGAVYDDVIELTGPLLALRAANLLTLAALWQLAVALWDPAAQALRFGTLRRSTLRRWAGITVAAVAYAAVFGARGHLGYEVDRARIQAELGGRVTSERITLYFAADTLSEADARLLLEDHTFRLEQLDAAFGSVYQLPISSYVYRDRAQKRRLMGAGRVYIAKPWLREIHLNPVPYGHSVIHHELVHVVMGQHAGGLLDVPTAWGLFPHMALIEGTAEAMEWYGESLTLHEWSAALRALDLAPDLRRLMGPEGFWSQSASKSYTLSGSFVRWLLDTRGPKALLIAYAEADWERAYGQPLEVLVSGWEAFLDGLQLPPSARDLAQQRYARKGIFQRTCPLEIARLLASAAELSRADKVDEALAVYRSVVGFVPTDPHKRVPIIQLLASKGRVDEALAEVEAVLALETTPAVTRARVWELLGDAQWRSGGPVSASESYARAAEEPQSEDRERNVLVKREVAGDAEREPILGPYLLGGAGEHAESVTYLTDAIGDLPGDPLPVYLLARRHVSGHGHADAVPLLESVVGVYRRDATRLGRLIEREAWRVLAHARLFSGDPSGAERAFEEAAAQAPYTGQRLLHEDWAARARWRAQRMTRSDRSSSVGPSPPATPTSPP